ncbi:MAG: HAMP domain-containing sensor histidine kinase [Myxococcota bacterium]
MPDPSPHWSARLLLIANTLAIPAFGVVREVLDVAGDARWSQRFAMAGVSAFVLWRSFHPGWFSRHLRAVCMVIAVWVLFTFTLESGRDGMTAGHVVSLMLIVGMSLSLVQRLREVLAMWVGALSIAAFAYGLAPEPAVPLLEYAAITTVVVAGFGAIVLSRVRLEQALLEAQRSLEDRVTERTEELGHSLQRLEQEIAERRSAEVAALRASRAKSRFLANMSHELRTPLNAILGYAELVQDELTDRGEFELVGDLHRVREGAQRLLRMVDDVLDLSRIEAGGLDIRWSDIDVGRSLTGLARLLEPSRVRSGSSLSVDVEPGLSVRSDAVRFEQIVLNLATNALKFTERGRVDLVARSTPDGVEVKVIDDGIGIPPDRIGALFQPFVQLDDSATRRHEGTGLGLALSRDLAQRLGGRIEVSSALGAGSTFTLWLPQVPPGATPAHSSGDRREGSSAAIAAGT